MAENTQFAGDCFTAQTISRHYDNYVINDDVGGLAVALSNIFINIALPIVLYWSEDNVQTTVFMLLAQVYPILIATASSVNSNNLSLFDAHFATAVTASPISVYIAYSSIRDFVLGPNTLFRRIKRGKNLIRILGASLPFFWIAINVITSFHPRAFRNSPQYCTGVHFSQWLLFQIVSNFVGVLDVMGRRDLWSDIEGRGGLGAVALVSMWVWAIYLVRHRFDILEDMEFRRHKEARLQRHRYIRAVLAIVDTPFASWHVISNAHPWMKVDIVVCLHWSWVLGIVKGMYLPNREFSYGQIMSLFVIIPPFSATFDLITKRWREIMEAIRHSPDYFMDGFMFLLFGSGNPWMEHIMRHQPSNSIAVHSKGFRLLRTTFAKLLYPTSLCITFLDVAWIYGYVRGGSIPNPKTMVNNPHEAWKPFSVALYIYGYCVCCVNLLAWTCLLDQHIINKKSVPHASSIPLVKPRLTIPSRLWGALLTTCILLGTFVVSAGPVFAPPAALPLAQQWQWSNFCANHNFPSYAILDGSDYANKDSKATFYLHRHKNIPTYRLTFQDKKTEETMVFYPESAQDDPTGSVNDLPAYNVSYHQFTNQFSVMCIPDSLDASSNSLSEQRLCATGNYSTPSTDSRLHVMLQDHVTGLLTTMVSVDRQWLFKDDAPSLVLYYYNGEGPIPSGVAPVMQTSVTKRNQCEVLKVCMSSETLDLQSVVAMGMILKAQQQFSAYCLQPRMYSI